MQTAGRQIARWQRGGREEVDRRHKGNERFRKEEKAVQQANR